MAQFSRWMSEMRLSLCDVNETLVEEFFAPARSDYIEPVSGYRRNHSRSPLGHLLNMLRAIELIPPKPIDMLPVAVELRRFDDFYYKPVDSREVLGRLPYELLADFFAINSTMVPSIYPRSPPHMFVIFLPHRLMSIEHR